MSGIGKRRMRDLSNLDSLKKQLIVVLLMPGDAGMGRNDALHLRNYIRLVDKAVYEYEMARADLIEEIEEKEYAAKFPEGGQRIFGFAFTDHMENCINATKRLLNIIDRIKGGTNSSLISKQIRRLTESLGKDVASVRHTIEHMDDKIHRGEIKEGKPVMIALSKGRDKITIADQHLDLEQLALLLKKLHEIGVHLLDSAPKSWP